MKRGRAAGVLALLAVAVLPACGTMNGVRWAFNKPSIYEKPDQFSESMAIRATFGAPVIIVGAAFDAVTFPFQAIFGVWPMWGSDSPQMNPDGR